MIERDDLLTCVIQSLAAITNPRFYRTERGYQGALLAQLDKRLRLQSHTIIEQEYQKQARDHGITIRPDIIVHEPFDPTRHHARTEGNLAVMELKLKAAPAEAIADFESLGLMLGRLRYRFGIFININSTSTHTDLMPTAVRNRVVCFAVALSDGAVTITK